MKLEIMFAAAWSSNPGLARTAYRMSAFCFSSIACFSFDFSARLKLFWGHAVLIVFFDRFDDEPASIFDTRGIVCRSDFFFDINGKICSVSGLRCRVNGVPSLVCSIFRSSYN